MGKQSHTLQSQGAKRRYQEWCKTTLGRAGNWAGSPVSSGGAAKLPRSHSSAVPRPREEQTAGKPSPAPQGTSPEGLWHPKEQPARPELLGGQDTSQDYHWEHGWCSWRGHTDNSQNQRSHWAMSEGSLPPWAWHWWGGRPEGPPGISIPYSLFPCASLWAWHCPRRDESEVRAPPQPNSSSASHQRDTGSFGDPQHKAPKQNHFLPLNKGILTVAGGPKPHSHSPAKEKELRAHRSTGEQGRFLRILSLWVSESTMRNPC